MSGSPSSNSGARIYASPRLIDGRVIFGANNGRVTELDVETLDVKGQLQLPDAVTNAVALSDDGRRMFVSTAMNALYAVERVGDLDCASTSPTSRAV